MPVQSFMNTCRKGFGLCSLLLRLNETRHSQPSFNTCHSETPSVQLLSEPVKPLTSASRLKVLNQTVSGWKLI